ncbi:hypothetical protein DPMN_024625 [Dreissena polymorpha]|uniref:Uncharacterized protein n=1 Tax=Dreissena polymorpha TaxID=45954 RepID=A0A9D4RAY0_DREPO|nr:hypothetical protein DPMN_024625 [Dreissena polymorpha]
MNVTTTHVSRNAATLMGRSPVLVTMDLNFHQTRNHVKLAWRARGAQIAQTHANASTRGPVTRLRAAYA